MPSIITESRVVTIVRGLTTRSRTGDVSWRRHLTYTIGRFHISTFHTLSTFHFYGPVCLALLLTLVVIDDSYFKVTAPLLISALMKPLWFQLIDFTSNSSPLITFIWKPNPVISLSLSNSTRCCPIIYSLALAEFNDGFADGFFIKCPQQFPSRNPKPNCRETK